MRCLGLTHPPAMETASSDGKMYHAHKHLGNVGTRDMQRPPPLMETASSDGKMYYACMHTWEMSEREICKGHLPSWKRHLLTAKCTLTRVGNETCQVCQSRSESRSESTSLFAKQSGGLSPDLESTRMWDASLSLENAKQLSFGIWSIRSILVAGAQFSPCSPPHVLP